MLHPNSKFEDYRQIIGNLSEISRDTVLDNPFLLQHDQNISIYYAPHNEYINNLARIVVVGITPGWSQTEHAYRTARRGILDGLPDNDICYECKIASRFAGVMRKNIISMLNQLELNDILRLDSSSELFDRKNTLLHTTSLVKYPCFYKGKNYSGHTPTMLENPLLRRYLISEFLTELKCINNISLIIPLGKAVESALTNLSSELPENSLLLRGFPHPSGLNRHRISQFERNYDSMKHMLRQLKSRESL